MASILRFRKLCIVEPVKCSQLGFHESVYDEKEKEKEEIISPGFQVPVKPKMKKNQPNKKKEWRCIDNCCWAIGYACTTCWLLLLLYNCLPATLIGLGLGLRVPETPGARLRREGLTAHHPVVLVPGIITGGLELWEGKPCFDGLFRRRLWGGSFTEIFRRLEILCLYYIYIYIHKHQIEHFFGGNVLKLCF